MKVEAVKRFIDAMDARDVAVVSSLADAEIEIIGAETAKGLDAVRAVAERPPEPLEERTDVLEWRESGDRVAVKARRTVRRLDRDDAPAEELVSGVFTIGPGGRIRHVHLFDDPDSAFRVLE